MMDSLTARASTTQAATTGAATAGRLAGRARGLLGTFAATSVAHLGALLLESRALEYATKPALMPLLAAHVLSARRTAAKGEREQVATARQQTTEEATAGRATTDQPATDQPALDQPVADRSAAGYRTNGAGRSARLLIPALLASAAGDSLLQVDGEAAFLAGMGSFAAAHVCYVTMFAKQGALTDRRRAALVAAAYATAWAVMMSQLWPGLGPLQIPVAGYSLLLASTAVTSAGLGLRAGLGGGLFLLSDTLIATRIAGWRQLPGHEFWIMSTYLLAQYLLASAALKAELAATADGEPPAPGSL